MNLIDSQAATYPDIESGLDSNDGVSRILMWQLRAAQGRERLGVKITAEISEELTRRGIGVRPALYDQTQWDVVRLYRKSSEVGKLIESCDKMTDKADKRLLNAAKCTDVINTIKQAIS